MTKNLSQRIAEKVRNKKNTKKAKNRGDFLVHKTDIEQAIIDGWSVKIIWETLVDEKKISVSYPAFNNYVNKLINKKTREKITNIEKNLNKNQRVDGFNFNSNPNKEDLI
ncbi:hypothetical protein A9G45_01350 [Gilliamella sp. HK2]|jgi:hypothetical protein|uniref:TraK family protein n=1 Tax=unclassified Gilliamella TaxID=2685620 RepID=UPI00080DC88C|nr:TraK family protein [Gilliamella apicola]OCG28961.1 hypothetical protein A9G46_01585 [Gilliamella apicola]OCG28994.1 hypothetical protein A9G46_01755 [Gilliamella apicola]OCG31441.1 hypothetical protein A9G45_01350 [Gilliamella apicola]